MATRIVLCILALFFSAFLGNVAASADDDLLALAHKQFDPAKDTKLNAPADEIFFRNVATGTATVYDHPTDGFDQLTKWPGVRAEWIVWLCTDPVASKLVNYRGINLSGARIDGKVDLSGAVVPFFITMQHCALTGDMVLRGAHLLMMDLSGSHIQTLNADDSLFDHSLTLADGFEADGQISLYEANIGGTLNFSHAQFKYAAPGHATIYADSAKIGGYALLRDSIYSGSINLLKATIGGDLDCTNARLNIPSGTALNGQGTKINGNAIFESGFSSQGQVNLLGAGITGYFIWRNVASPATSTLHLESAYIGTLLDESESWPNPGKLYLDGLAYDRIVSSSKSKANRLEWLSRMAGHQFLPQPYEQLASVLKNMGYDQDAIEVLIGMNQARGRILHAQLRTGPEGGDRSFLGRWYARFMTKEWWWYNVFGWLVGYGYRPGRAFGISVGFIVLGYLLFRSGYFRGLMWPPPDALSDMHGAGEPFTTDGGIGAPKDYCRFNAFIYSLETFTPLLQLDQNARWRPNANRGRNIRLPVFSLTTGGLLRAYLWLHVIAGWILTTLWVGAVSGLVKN